MTYSISHHETPSLILWSSVSTGSAGMGCQGPTLLTPCWGLLFLVLYLHLTSTGLFLEWSSWLRERKELWEAIPGSLVGLEFLLQALEF